MPTAPGEHSPLGLGALQRRPSAPTRIAPLDAPGGPRYPSSPDELLWLEGAGGSGGFCSGAAGVASRSPERRQRLFQSTGPPQGESDDYGQATIGEGKRVMHRCGYFMETLEDPKKNAAFALDWPVLDAPITAPNLEIEELPGPELPCDKVLLPLPLNTPPPVPQPQDGTFTEGSWRVRHERSDNADLPTALRPRPTTHAPPFQDVIVEPREEVLVLLCSALGELPGAATTTAGGGEWVRVECANGEGWLKRCHLREGGWTMVHMRDDHDSVSTALRERPSSKARPLEGVKAEPYEEVLVHIQQDVSEPGGRPPCTWARVACALGEGWLKRLHLKEAPRRATQPPRWEPPPADRLRPTACGESPLPLGPARGEEASTPPERPPPPTMSSESPSPAPRMRIEWGLALPERVPPPTLRSDSPPPPSPLPPTRGGPLPGSQPAPAGGDSPPPERHSSPDSPPSPELARSDSEAKGAASSTHSLGSDIKPCFVRIHLGKLEFDSNSMGSLGFFETVAFRVHVQLGEVLPEDSPLYRPPPSWTEQMPVTPPQPPKYCRSVSENGRYSARVLCDFDEALDLPWPPPAPPSEAPVASDDRCQPPPEKLPEKLTADVWLERVTVADRFDRVLGSLGLGSSSGVDRKWLGRALADLPPENVDEVSYPWPILDACRGTTDSYLPKTLSIGVEWVTEPLELDD